MVNVNVFNSFIDSIAGAVSGNRFCFCVSSNGFTLFEYSGTHLALYAKTPSRRWNCFGVFGTGYSINARRRSGSGRFVPFSIM